MKTALRSLAPQHLVLAAFALTLAGVGAAPARADQFSSYWEPSRSGHTIADGRLVDVEIRVKGRTAPLYFRPKTWDKHYFQAFQGQNYALVLTNNSNRRIGVLIAVDGLNVVNGERSRLSRNEPMYVLDPFETATINGWRSSLNHVQQFVFVDEERSYAERTGQANGDLGWIRVLAFDEKRPLAWGHRPRFKDSNEPRSRPERQGNELAPEGRDDDALGNAAPETEAPSDRREAAKSHAQLEQKQSRARESVPGTGWGTRRFDPVQRTVFNAANRATDKIVFRYEYASGLRALGIFPQRSRLWEREQGQLGFAKPPRW